MSHKGQTLSFTSTLRKFAYIVVFLTLICANDASDAAGHEEHGGLCASLRNPKSQIAGFLSDVWPTLRRSHAVLVNVTLPAARDLTKPPQFRGAHLSPEPPPLNWKSTIWTEGWGSGERPPTDLVHAWISAPKEQRIDCGKDDQVRWGMKLVSSAEASMLTRWRPNEPQSATTAIWIGVPAFSRSGKLSLLQYLWSGPGITGEDMLFLYRKDGGHWHQVGQATLGQF